MEQNNKKANKTPNNAKAFINPYNFIPFENKKKYKSERISREKAYENKKELLSGWLTVKLETKTPLIIPDGAHPKVLKDEHKEYDFFRLPGGDGKRIPVIPGSELRGMIRSVYEAVTDSCVAFLLDDKPISGRVPTYAALKDRGLLTYEKDNKQWVLYKAKVNVSKKVTSIKADDAKGYVVANGKKLAPNGTYIEDSGWLQYNIPVVVGERNKYHIVYLEKAKELKRWPTEDNEPYKALKSALERDGAGAGKSRNKIPNKNLRSALENAKNGQNNMVPVYYMDVMRGGERLVYLSNSSIGRIAQRRKWKDIMGDYAPCESTDALCPACLLFGTTSGKGMKGKVQVTDAIPKEIKGFKKHTLQILSTPRVSAFEFYLRKPNENATFWNFDFYGESVEDDNNPKRTKIEYHDLANATPRGRKMYWHSKIAKDNLEKNKLNTTVEAVEGSFQFKIYFDEITKQQLENLKWVVTLGENKSDSALQHKLGHAKPLGYGSVKLQVLQQAIRHLSYDKENEKIEFKIEETAKEELMIPARLCKESISEDSLLDMLNTKTIPDDVPVMYPKDGKTGEENIFTWFAKNRRNSKSVRTLPEPTEINGEKLKGRWSDEKMYTGEKRMYGTVKFYNADKNFGFIKSEDGNDYSIKCHIHYNPEVKPEDLKSGRKVSFILGELGDGKKVINHCRLE